MSELMKTMTTTNLLLLSLLFLISYALRIEASLDGVRVFEKKMVIENSEIPEKINKREAEKPCSLLKSYEEKLNASKRMVRQLIS